MLQYCGFNPHEVGFDYTNAIGAEEFLSRPLRRDLERDFEYTESLRRLAAAGIDGSAPNAKEQVKALGINPPKREELGHLYSNTVSQPLMFRLPPPRIPYFVEPTPDLDHPSARYYFAIVRQEWLGIAATREVRNRADAIVVCRITRDIVCGGQAVGCFSWGHADGKFLLEVRADTMPQYGHPALLSLEIGVHEWGHLLGLDEGYISRNCDGRQIGGPDYIGSMGFAEGARDRLGGNASIAEKATVRRAKRTGQFPTCG